MSQVRVAVLADTHAPRRWRSCPSAVAVQLRGADLILHAGDVCTPAVLDELAGYAPVQVVQGNNDGRDVAAWGAPEALHLDLDGLRVAMVHDARRRAAWPGCAAVFPPPAWWCSGTRTSRSTMPGMASASSTPARLPTVGGSPMAPWASWISRAETWSAPASSR